MATARSYASGSGLQAPISSEIGDSVDLLLDPDPLQLPALELRRAVGEDPDLQALSPEAADRLDRVLEQLDQVDRANPGVRVGGVELVVELPPGLEAVADVVAPVGVVVDLAAQQQLVVAVGELVRARLELLSGRSRGSALRTAPRPAARALASRRRCRRA